MRENSESFPDSNEPNNETSRELEKMKRNMEAFQQRAENAHKAERLAHVGKGKTEIEYARDKVLRERQAETEINKLKLPQLDGMPELEDLSDSEDVVRVETILADLKKGTPQLQWNIIENGGMDHLV